MIRRLVSISFSVALLGLVPASAAAEPAFAAPSCASPTITGTNGHDNIVGTEGDDVILALAGDDVIDGLGGNDEICGGLGRDIIHGGDGDDILKGGPGRDSVFGNKGADMLLGGNGNDTLRGGNGSDEIHGNDGKDTLLGQGGRDRLYGGGDEDTLNGRNAVDRLWGQGGDDLLIGGDGNDRLRGGTGFDWLKGKRGDDLLIGGPDGDVLYGQRHNDTLRGQAGNDTIRAGFGDDLLDGGAGDDLLDASLGADTCFDDGSEIPCPKEPGNAYGGHVTVADDQEPPTLNRFVPGGDNFIVTIIGQSYFAGVAEIDGHTLGLIPELVTELPTVANGGVTVNGDDTMTVRYNIRPEAVWSDGMPINGFDFQFTLDTILDPGLPVDKTTYEDIISSTATDKTFEYTLAAPTLLHEGLFETIIPKHAVEGSNFATDWNDAMWPSAGPFVFQEWDKGDFVRVVRNENYWKTDPTTGQQLPYLDGVTFEFIPETLNMIRAFERRDVEVIDPPPALNTINRLRDSEPGGGVVEVLGGPVWEHIHFQFGPRRLERNPNSANENINYRKGVLHTIDRQLLVDEILDGYGSGVLPSFVDAFTPSLSNQAWDQYDYNPTTAMAYFEQAKIDLGVDELSTVFTTTSNNDARVQMAALLQPMFEAVGIVYESQLEDSQIFFGTTIDNGTWDLGEWAWVGSHGLAGVVSILDVWDPEAPPPDGSNYYRWGTPDSSVINGATMRFAELRDEAYATVDEVELADLIDEAQTILADEAVFIPLYERLVVLAYWGDEVGNVKHNTSRASHTWNIENWYRADR